MKRLELKGQRFNKLLVMDFVEVTRNKSRWLCRCDCGNSKVIEGRRLVSGRTRSCGCLIASSLKDRSLKHGHKGSGQVSKEYTCWQNMKSRCDNPLDKSYKYYGGRGIIICERWRDSFENFYNDLGEMPQGHTLDRIDNDGPYSPENCRWATIDEQGYNKRSNRLITFNGETKALTQWAKILKINVTTLWNRLYTYNWGVEKAFSVPVGYSRWQLNAK